MKPKDLKLTNSEKKVLVADRVWHVPPGESRDFHFEGFSSKDFFNNVNPTYMEICSGNGLWIAEKAKALPGINWMGVEIKWGRVRKIWSKIHNHRLPNLMALFGEASSSIERFIPDASVDRLFINFPDPWPKRRHAKFRLIQSPFVAQLGRILKPEGELCIVTDDAQYSNQIIKLVNASPLFRSKFEDPFYITEMEGYGTSYFEDLWRGKKREIRYHIFIRHH